MDTSAVRASVDIGAVSYGAQVNSTDQSIPNSLPVANNDQSNPAVQLVLASPASQLTQKADELADLHRKTAAMNQFVEATDTNTQIHFKLHQKTNELMVQIVDQKTNKVLREYPSQEFLDTIAAIRSIVGMMLDKKA